MGRSPCCDKTMVKKGPWSPEEDDLLQRFLTQFGNGGNWISLPKKVGLNRCGKSCRLRWLNYLRPNIKHGDFTEDEDQIIYMLYNIVGSRWSVIASKLPRRTDNDVKNYWNTKLRRKILSGKFKSVPFGGIAKNNYGAQTCVNNTNNITNCKSQNMDVVSSQLNQYQLVMHHKEDDKNIISLEKSDEIYDESSVSRTCVTPLTSQCSGSSTNITLSGVENEFWMDLFSGTFDDDDVVVGSKLVEEKINEISSLLHVFVD